MTQDNEAERPEYLIRKQGAWYRPNCCGYTASAIQAGRYTMAEAEKITHPNGPDGPRDGMHYVHEDEVICDDLKAYRTQAARIAELEADLQAVLRREEDANKAAFAHMRRITALEADGIAARKAAADNYARADAADARSAALVAAAYEEAGDLVHRIAKGYGAAGDGAIACGLYLTEGNIRALTPADASAALAHLIAEGKAEGMREAADLIPHCGQCGGQETILAAAKEAKP